MTSKFLDLYSGKWKCASSSAARPAAPQARQHTSSADVPAPRLANLAMVQAPQAQPLQTVVRGEGSVVPLLRKKQANDTLRSEEVTSKSPPPPIEVDSREGSPTGRQSYNGFRFPFKLVFSPPSIHDVATKVRSSNSRRVERAIQIPGNPGDALRRVMALTVEVVSYIFHLFDVFRGSFFLTFSLCSCTITLAYLPPW